MPPETNDTAPAVPVAETLSEQQQPQDNAPRAFDIKELYDTFDSFVKKGGASAALRIGAAAGAIADNAMVPSANVAGDGSITFDVPANDTASDEVRTGPQPVSGEGDLNFGIEDGGEGTAQGNVIKDDQGRVTEVQYPNGTARKFEYGEDGKLSKITQPDGTVLALVDGQWQIQPQNQQQNGGGSGVPGRRPGKNDSAAPGEEQPKPQPPAEQAGKGLANGISSMFKGVDMVDPQVSEDGTFTYHEKDGDEVKIFTNGASWIHNEEDGSYVNKDGDGRVTSIVYGNATVRNFGYDADGNLNSFSQPDGSRYHMQDGQWLDQNGDPAKISGVEVNDKGVVTYTNDATGQTIRSNPDRTEERTNVNGSRLAVNADGQVIGFRSADGRMERAYTYGDDGKLQEVSDNQGNKFTANADGTWTDQDGNKITNLKIEDDGYLQYTNKDGNVVIQNTDGKTETSTLTEQQLAEKAEYLHGLIGLPSAFGLPGGPFAEHALKDLSPADRVLLQQQYEEKYGSKLTDDLVAEYGWDWMGDEVVGLEAANLIHDAGRNLPPRERQEFVDNLNTFMQRAEQSGMSNEEIARTLAATDRLLTAEDGKVDAQLRKMLAQQIMANAADPAGIDQGGHLTCNVTDIEVVTYSRNPAVAAEMVADIALTGQWTAPDGHVVKIPPQNLLPQEGSYGSASSDDRTFASQLFQATALSDWGSRQTPPIYYMQGQPDAQNSTGEYWTDADGNFIMEEDKKTGEMVPKGFHGWHDDPIVEELRRLNGDDSTFLVHKDGGGGDNIVTFESEKQFREALERAEKEGKMPLILVVAAGDPVFGGSANPGDEEHGLNHVVVIDDYNPTTGQVRVNNSWGDGNDKWVSLEDLYRATRP